MFQTRAPPGRWKPAGLFESLPAATGGHMLSPTEPFGPSFIFASSPWTQPASTRNFPEASTLQETKSAHLHHPALAFPLNPSPPHHTLQRVKSWNQQAKGQGTLPASPDDGKQQLAGRYLQHKDPTFAHLVTLVPPSPSHPQDHLCSQHLVSASRDPSSQASAFQPHTFSWISLP